MSTHTARHGILNYLTGQAICSVPRSADEAVGLLQAYRAEVLEEAAETVGPLCEQYGVLGVGSALRKLGGKAFSREEKDTSVGGTQPLAGAEFTARAQILTALQAAGHTPKAAAELLARADREPRDPAPDPDFRESLGGGHALVVEYGDCELHGSCQCGTRFGHTTPDVSLDTFVGPWVHHTNTEVTG